MPSWRSAILPLRWPITVVCGLLVAGGWAARRDRDKNDAPPEPEPAAAPEEETPNQARPEPAPEPSQLHQGPLFPEGLPMGMPALPKGLANPTAQACAACHGDIAEAWQASAHATAWKGERFTQAVRDASKDARCLACHLPYQAQHPELVADYAAGDVDQPRHQPNPSWSPTLQAEGITCASCHLRDGVIIGPRGSETAPHPTSASADLASPALCGSCHQLGWPDSEVAWYDTYGEWYRSAYQQAGVGCQDCHMPQQAATVAVGRFASHAGHGLLTRPQHALSVLLELGSPQITRGEPFGFSLRLQNTGAGHAFPTGHPEKAYLLQAVVVDAEGTPLHEPLEHQLVRKVETAPPHALIEDTRIPARGEITLEHESTIPHKKPAGPAVLRVTIAREGEERSLLERSFPVTVL